MLVFFQGRLTINTFRKKIKIKIPSQFPITGIQQPLYYTIIFIVFYNLRIFFTAYIFSNIFSSRHFFNISKIYFMNATKNDGI